MKMPGATPTRIIKVNDTIVESFLGRIEAPEKSKNISLNIINDPAFRTGNVYYCCDDVIKKKPPRKQNTIYWKK